MYRVGSPIVRTVSTLDKTIKNIVVICSHGKWAQSKSSDRPLNEKVGGCREC